MACEIRMNGVTYTREEFDKLPPTSKLGAILNSTYLNEYVDLGIKNLSDGGFTEVHPVAQAQYVQAQEELIDTLRHAQDIRAKIKDVFGKHMTKTQVEYALILLDTMAQSWSTETGQAKEVYYQRYADVKQSTLDELEGDDVDFQAQKKNTAQASLFDEVFLGEVIEKVKKKTKAKVENENEVVKDVVPDDQSVDVGRSDDLIYRAAVETVGENQVVLHAIESPDLGSLAHEFMHVAEQDLSDEDVDVLQEWSGSKKGTSEFREKVADGFVKFLSEDQPELNTLNNIFSKISKMLRNLYKNIVSSPLDINLTDDVRMVYARLLGVDQSFSRRVNSATNNILDMNDSTRATFIKKNGLVLKEFASVESKMKKGTQVVTSKGQIGIIGVDDLSGASKSERKDGIKDMLALYPIIDVAGLYTKQNSVKSSKNKNITPSCV